VQHNTKPKPFIWTKTAEDILERECRALDALDEIRGNREQMSDSGTPGDHAARRDAQQNPRDSSKTGT